MHIIWLFSHFTSIVKFLISYVQTNGTEKINPNKHFSFHKMEKANTIEAVELR